MKHVLKALPENVHWGYFDASLKPVLRIKSGDTVEVFTIEVGNLEFMNKLGKKFTKEIREIFDSVKERGPGPHVLTGPIYVEDAKPGDVLEISLLKVEPWYDYGLNLMVNGKGVLSNEFTKSTVNCIPLDIKNRVAILPHAKIPISPFYGILSVAPAAGRITSDSVGPHGGNMDVKELVASSKVYLPIEVDGALFSIGDGHSCQGDGEVDKTALETSMKGLIRLRVRKNIKIKMPMAETKNNYILMAFASSLDAALKIAVKSTIEFLVSKGFGKKEAYIFCSLCVDFRISQAVGDFKGIHAMVPKGALRCKTQST